MMEAEVGVMCFEDRGKGLQLKQCRPLEAEEGKEKDSLLEPAEGNSPVNILTLAQCD